MHTRLFYEPEKNQRLAEFFFSFLGKVKFVAGASEFVADSRISILVISIKQVLRDSPYTYSFYSIIV